ncbi:MAG: diguanylate cyclase [Actinomycetales bacterium]|nr:diguanylate cyclase [Actinomycetales bacterium]
MVSSAPDHELVYESQRTRVRRLRRREGTATVIVKEPMRLDAAERVRRETAALDRLTEVPGVVHLAEHGTGGAVVLEDLGGEALGDVLPLDVPTALRYALELTRTVARVHERGVVHRDITPANVVLSGPGPEPVLIDFECASTAAEERPGFTHHREMIGTLAYLAPEQTGRTSHPVDHRADLYALGATLYEMLAGEPPFGFGEALQLVHDALVRVPTPLSERVPDLPPLLSDVVTRLLEKEPDRRYQSASGLAHDLVELSEGRLERLGERDYPVRLSAPSRPVGRETEIAALHEVFHASLGTPRRGVLVSGGPGVGKSTLINELRPVVAARGGWLVSGKSDQYQHDAVAGAGAQVMRMLCRTLLAEPEAQLEVSRARISASLGANAGLLAELVPELGVLLGGTPRKVTLDDPTEGLSRLRQAGLDLLRAVVSPDRPLVMVLDDLQWSTVDTLELADVLLGAKDLHGLLVVGAYRPADVDAEHPFATMRARWDRLGMVPASIELSNLEPTALATMCAGMLRLPTDRAAALATAVGARTDGNPYDTVELINALRRDGVLTLGERGWSWDDEAIRRHIGSDEVIDLLRDRIDALPASSREVLAALSHLGGAVPLPRIAAAVGRPAAAVLRDIAPALEDNLLVVDQEHLRFRHDRVQQAAHEGVPAEARDELRLAMARRLAAAGYDTDAAEQYLTALDGVSDADERRQAARLFQVAATQAMNVTNYRVAERFLSAEADVIDSLASVPEDLSLIALDSARHAVLYGLNRLDEADQPYESFLRRGPDPVQLAATVALQINSLTNRGRAAEAITIGVDALAALGFSGPPDDLAAEIGRRIGEVYAWIEQASVEEDLARPEVTDPRVPAAALLLNRLGPPSYAVNPMLIPWTVLEGQRLWAEYGPCPALPALVGGAGMSFFGAPEDFAVRARIVRHVMAVGEARGYQPATANAQMIYAQACEPWFEPGSHSVRDSQQAHELLLRYGDALVACCTYIGSISGMIDCSPALDDVDVEAESGEKMATRIGSDLYTGTYGTFRLVPQLLRGDSRPEFDEDGYIAANMPINAYGVACLHINLGLVAAILDDTAGLTRHMDALAPLLFMMQGATYARGRLLSALSLAQRAAAVTPDKRPEMLARFDEEREWWARRAADCPNNFRHLLHLLDAERAWAAGDGTAALRTFDKACRTADVPDNPWQRAYIAERSGLCHLAHGMDRTGRWLLSDARTRYAAWGAAAKVAEMDRTHSFLASRVRQATSISNSMSADMIDMMAILQASQALSGETNLDSLHTMLTEQLGTLTGATTVHLELPTAPSGHEHLPHTALRYVERTLETLLVDDATQDDRFARDPYFSALDQCSLLVTPILNQGVLRAVLLLANERTAGAFTASGLDAVRLIAGQLAVSLDNALLYRSLEERVAKRTQELENANRQLEILSTTDALTKLANRRRFNETLELEWARAVRNHQPLAVIIIDIDHFKRYNDHYGHLRGDECLRRVGDVLAQCARRATDLACRYGGEEFTIILPDTDAENAALVAGQVLAAVAGLKEPHALSEHGVVTVSIGHATTVPTGSVPPESLVQAADAALYRAKSSGRNCVMCQE